MGYYSDVAIAFGGKPQAIATFVEAVQHAHIADAANLLEKFTVEKAAKYFTVYSVVLNSYKWLEEDEAIWEALKSLAIAHDLNYAFYRMGESYGDNVEDIRLSRRRPDKRIAVLFASCHRIEKNF